MAAITKTPAHPSFTNSTPRCRELNREINELWENSRIRHLVMIEAWSQIPVGFGLLIGSYATIIITKPHSFALLGLLVGMAVGASAMGGLFHDSNHKATFSPFGYSRRYDYIMAWIVSEVFYGLCGYHWSRKHDLHHTETNILDLDGDLNIEPMFRLHPGKAVRRSLVRYQHIYAWILYLLFPIPLQIRGHWIAWRGGNHGAYRIKPARGWNLAGTITGPVLFYTWTVALPVWQYGWIAVPVAFGMYCIMGVYGLLFQLAHCMNNVEFPTIGSLQGMHMEGFVFQLMVTTDFAPYNVPLGYFTAGLGNQSGHHVKAKFPYPFYRFMRRLVLVPWCRRHGVRYNVNATLWSAIKCHYNFLKEMGLQGRFVEFEMG